MDRLFISVLLFSCAVVQLRSVREGSGCRNFLWVRLDKATKVRMDPVPLLVSIHS